MENSNTKNIVSVEVLDKVFPHIAGYDEIRREAYQIVDIFKNPDLYKERGGHCPKGWLLYGVPGTGKSRIVLDMRDYYDVSKKTKAEFLTCFTFVISDKMELRESPLLLISIRLG